IAAESKVTMIVLGVGKSIDPALAKLETKAVYLTPLSRLPNDERLRLYQELNSRHVATFSILGEQEVRAGVLVGRRPVTSSDKIARRVALHIVRIARGDAPESLRVSMQLPERLMINMKTARTIKISPSWRVLTEAELIDYASGRTARKIDLISVMKEALAGNLNVRALELALSAGEASVRGSRASLLPNISASSTARTIDKDGALFAPQHLWNGKISATQVLWSERAWAGYSVQKLAQKSRKYELVTGKLDVLGDVAVAYLNVVRAKTVVRIQHDNLKATRANLEAARAQFDAGASSKADVYRWDSQIANARKALIDASASRNIAEISLQQILNRPPEERFETTDELSQPQAIELLQGIERYLNNPSTFRLFRQFLIAEAVRRSPEIQQLDAAIAVQVRLEKSAKRALYSPTLSATGSVSQRFYRGGASSTQPVPNGTDWFLGLTLSVPIYEGGRYAEIDRNSLEVSRLQAQRLNIENSISQRAATRLHQMGASFAGIGLGREAAEAAEENYKLVAAAYAEGAVRIVDVIDAQNAWFTSDSRAADSVYVFLIDWMNVQRAVGHFTTLMEKSERQVLIKRVDAYIAQEKQAP
ncbi:MAG: TolC family protein, partial [Kofleriaceae bacterium]|nr:TolC family protein [Kofleriaceae bacterium]